MNTNNNTNTNPTSPRNNTNTTTKIGSIRSRPLPSSTTPITGSTQNIRNPGGTARRRPSIVVVEKEKKTDFWKDVERTSLENGKQVSSNDFNQIIARAMALGVVGDKKQRESIKSPKSQELLENLKTSMEQKIVELNGGKQINLDTNNTSLMDKILLLERALSNLEIRQTKKEEEEKKNVQDKIFQLERALKEMESRIITDERKTGTKLENKETYILRRKLALFEQKLQEMETEKKMREEEEKVNLTTDKIYLLEDKLSKMENRKSTIFTLELQQKMHVVEEQLAILRNAKGSNDTTNIKIAEKISLLEKQLQSMAKTIANPPMIVDEDTIALREHIKKLEDTVLQQERKMEEQRNRIEAERKERDADLVRRIDHLASRIPDRSKPDSGKNIDSPDLLAKILALENKLAQAEEKIKNLATAYGSSEGINSKLATSPREVEQLNIEDINSKLAEIHKKLMDSDTSPREVEQLNIKYDKLMTKLEQTPEYKKQQEEQTLIWKKENEAPNKEAFDKVFSRLSSFPENKLNAVFKKKPELKFILKTPKQIRKTHPNDFKILSTQGLVLIEARALYHNMPVFKKDKHQKQLEFVEQLRQKIEIASLNQPLASAPIQPKKKVVIKTKNSASGGGDFLQELMQRRKLRE